MHTFLETHRRIESARNKAPALAGIAAQPRYMAAHRATIRRQSAVRLADSDAVRTHSEQGVFCAVDARGTGIHAVFAARMQVATQTAVTQFAN